MVECHGCSPDGRDILQEADHLRQREVARSNDLKGKADYGSLKWVPQHGGARAIDDGDLLPSEPVHCG